MGSTRLNDQQMAFFDTLGSCPFRRLLADCADKIIDEFEAVWAAHGGGHNGALHDGVNRSCICPFPDLSEYLSSLLDDPRIHDIAAVFAVMTLTIQVAMEISTPGTPVGTPTVTMETG